MPPISAREALLPAVRSEVLSPAPVVTLPVATQFKVRVRRLMGRHQTIDVNTLNWPTALALLGLAQEELTSPSVANSTAISRLLFRIDDHRRHGRRWLVDLDQAAVGYTFLNLEEGHPDAGLARQLSDEIAAFLLREHVRGEDGTLPYRRDSPDVRFVDTIGLVCPFLAQYGAKRESAEARSLCVRQILTFLDHATSGTLGELAHAYRSSDGSLLGRRGWGRGAGWLMLGIADSWEHLPSSPDKDRITAFFRECGDALILALDAEGYLHTTLDDHASPRDTSATAMVGYAIMRGVETGALAPTYTSATVPMVSALTRSMLPNGRIADCEDVCTGLGQHPEDPCDLWAHGAALAFLALRARVDTPRT